MKILLASDQRTDPSLLASYLAGRLRGRPADIDVLTVISGSEELEADATNGGSNIIGISESGRDYRQACAHVATLASELQRAGLRAVRTHVEYGDPADVILASSRQWRSDLLLIGTPRRRGLLTAFRLEGVTRRLLRWSDCPVELLRPDTQAMLDDVQLLPLPVDAAAQLPLQRLQSLPWHQGSRLHLLGVLPPGLDESRVEANPAATLLALQHARDAHTRAAAVLANLQTQLSALLPQGVQLTCDLAEGSLRELVVQRVEQLQPNLLLLSHTCFDGGGSPLFHSLSPTALALSVQCPVLSLQDRDAAPLPQRRTDTARILKLAR